VIGEIAVRLNLNLFLILKLKPRLKREMVFASMMQRLELSMMRWTEVRSSFDPR
jgi:hypothetical protein